MPSNILVIGSTNTDLTIRTDRLPSPGETVLGGSFAIFPGGKGTNQAVAARRAGADVSFAGAVGDDDFGAQTRERLARERINIEHLITIPGASSGVALILVDGKGENIIAVAPGANHALQPQALEAIEFRDFSLVLLQLEIPLEAVARAVERAHAAGCRIVLNPSPVADLPDSLLSRVDVLIPNRGELGRLSGMDFAAGSKTNAGGDEELEQAARRLMKKGVGEVVATLGAEGCLWISPEGVRHFPAPRVAAVDTVGAGDCFAGTLCASLARGLAMPGAIRFAIAAAALSVQRPGAQTSFPTREEIESQL